MRRSPVPCVRLARPHYSTRHYACHTPAEAEEVGALQEDLGEKVAELKVGWPEGLL